MDSIWIKELKKILLDKKIKIFFLIIIAIQINIFLVSLYKFNTSVINLKEYSKIADSMQGSINWDLVDKDLLTNISNKYDDTLAKKVEFSSVKEAWENEYYKSAINNIDRQRYINSLEEKELNGNDYNIEEEIKNLKNIEEPGYSNSVGINLFVQNITSIFTALVFVILSLMVVAFHDSIERLSGFDEFIISSKKGYHSMMFNKIFSEYFFISLLITIYYMVFLLLYIGMYKNYGSLEYKINSMGIFTYSIYNISIKEYLLNSYFRLLFGILSITSFIILVKEVVKNKIIGNIIAVLLVFLPLTLPRVGCISKVVVLSPIFSMQGEFSYENAIIYRIFNKSISYTSISMTILIIIFVIANIYIFRRKIINGK